MFDWKKILLSPKASLEKSIKVLHEGGYRIALVVDEQNKLLGTVTDGDIRRALITKFTMDSEIKLIMNAQPIKISKPFSRKELLSIMSSKGLMHMPIVDKDGVLCGLETMEHLVSSPSYDNPIFLMAGGFGTRLHPLTKNTPKPLLEVGNMPILETIIKQFIDHGFHNFYISTHFKSEQIVDYFKNGDRYGVKIQYIHEDTPLGTAGSLGLLPDNLPDLPIIMMNGDLLTSVDYKDLLDFHNDNDANATMCVREYDFQVPYGVVDIDGCLIRGIKEKPIHKFFVNAGIYVLNKSLINRADGESYLDMTDLLESELDSSGVNAFPIHEYWLDIGHIDEYEKANRDAVTIFNL
ncbi:MAG: CBS domain-containing protein [Candidatus Marinimicrobia bacterium]|nr:CBS domain-containing protein [Candidatus Neomarinimicrobiota bacterium]